MRLMVEIEILEVNDEFALCGNMEARWEIALTEFPWLPVIGDWWGLILRIEGLNNEPDN